MVSQDTFVQVLRIQPDANFAGWFAMAHEAVYPCRGFAFSHWCDDSLLFHLRQFLFDLLLHFERDSPWWVYHWRYCGVDGDNRDVLQTEPVRFSERSAVRVLTGQGQSTHEHVRTESLFCKQKIDFRFHFRVRPVPMAKRLGTFKKISRKPCCSRVTK